jgi:hypothetical protein
MNFRVPEDQFIEVERPAQYGDAVAHLGLALRDAESLGPCPQSFYVGYHYRWLRPTDYIQQAPELIARSSPVRRQLLGALPPSVDPLGSDPVWEPSSRYWLLKDDEDVPLKGWAEERSVGGQKRLERAHI